MGNLCSFSISTDVAVSRCWDCIVGQASYTCKLQANVEALTDALEELRALRDDVNREVDLAEQRLMKRLSQVEFWLSRSQLVISEAEQLLRDVPRETEKLCLGGYFSTNCMSSYKFGRQVTGKLGEIAELKSKGVFEKIAENEPAAAMDGFRPAEPTVGLESTLTKVCSLLEQKEVGMIGLYGLGGVGKTTLLTQMYNKLSSLSSSCYDAILWVVVSKDHNIEIVQEKIWEKLHLSMESWNHKSSDEKSQDIYRILSGKRFVLFLDDIWERVDLIELGVPLPSQENGSKVVFTTRLFDICGQMGAKDNIEIRCLGDTEAWALFQHKVGEETLNSHPDIRELAKMVAAECRGLPLALTVIGRAMTGKRSPKSWEFAIEALKNSAHKFGKIARELYTVLKFSYDNLPSDTMRFCLLYCCLFPEDYPIRKSVLIGYWFCEGFLDAFESINKAYLQGHDIIDSLINASLLEQDGENFVRMHDVIRDMALWISCECEVVEQRFYVQAGLQLTETPEAGRWQGVRRVSFMQNQIKCLTSTPICPNVQTLFLGNNGKLARIENGFFQFMPNLRVLNLSRCWRLRELPKGISELVSLECLDLYKTSIVKLPIELNNLTQLKCLDLSCMNNLVGIPKQLISSFSKLQVFRIGNVTKGEIRIRVLIGDEDLGVIEELGSLQHLNEIHIGIKGGLALETLMRFRNLQDCTKDLQLLNFCKSKVFNGLCFANMKSLRWLTLSDCESLEEMKIERGTWEGRIQFHSLETVRLLNCGKLRDMTWLILAPNLRRLVVSSCRKMEEIISEEKLSDVAHVPFPNLKWLYLRNLPDLKSIYPKALPFLFLDEIKVEDCSKLMKLPLNSDSAKGNNPTIVGKEEWWRELEWEDEATRIAFLPSFTPI